MLSETYWNVLILFSCWQDPCLSQNPDVHWIGTGALQSAQIWSPRKNSSAPKDHLEPPHKIGVCNFLPGQDGTHCLDCSFMLYLLCFRYCCFVTVYYLTRIFCHLVPCSLECLSGSCPVGFFHCPSTLPPFSLPDRH